MCIRDRCVDKVFTACRAVAGVTVDSLDHRGQGKGTASTPLHTMCNTLAAMNDDRKAGAAKRTVFIDHIPANGPATEAKLREALETCSYVRDFDKDVEWVRLRTRPDGITIAVSPQSAASFS